ncbi:hypothetical protein [Terrabacter sp. 2RAF25]|uniref:hypothetical protein n=1 Tax=Terrabacter sp. 2RAF25 TaxID=3232998 RepID=UPI003F98C845
MDESAHFPDHDHEFDDTPDPRLDPHVEAQVTALLAATPDPGPMPDHVEARISAALLDAARLRVDPGPMSTADRFDTGPESGGGHTGADVLALPTRANAANAANRPKPLYLVAAVAAAAAVVAVGASALHVTKRPNGAAIVGDTSSSKVRTPGSPGSGGGGLHIQLSTTAYDSGNLATKARELLDRPGQPIRDLAAESPGIGPIATPIGLEACLEAIGALDATSPSPEAVSADLATFDGRPAVVVVVTRAGASTAWAVERSCSTGTPGLLKDATPVP